MRPVVQTTIYSPCLDPHYFPAIAMSWSHTGVAVCRSSADNIITEDGDLIKLETSGLCSVRDRRRISLLVAQNFVEHFIRYQPAVVYHLSLIVELLSFFFSFSCPFPRKCAAVQSISDSFHNALPTWVFSSCVPGLAWICELGLRWCSALLNHRREKDGCRSPPASVLQDHWVEQLQSRGVFIPLGSVLSPDCVCVCVWVWNKLFAFK